MKDLLHLANGATRRLALMVARSLPLPVATDLIEKLSEEMITEVSVGEQALFFYTPTSLLRARAAATLSKEADMIRWIDAFEGNSVFWDVGANVGTYTLYASVKRGASVLAFEPSSSNYHVLTKNIVINSLRGRATAYCLAFADATVLAAINLGSAELGSALNQFGEVGEKSPYCLGHGGAAWHGMVGFTIDDFVEQFNPPFPSYLKIDVDGLEPAILAGALKTLGDSRLHSVMVELSVVQDRKSVV